MSITLALESAIAGGSISLLSGVDEIDFWIGTSDVSKAEDLLINIDALLCRNDLSPRDIDLIAVSAGPGSFTGIRIGIATALGLRSGLQVLMSNVSALEAIAALSQHENMIVAVPMGRNSVCTQHFTQRKAAGEPHTIDGSKFVEIVRQDIESKYVMHEKLYSAYLRFAHVTDFGSDVAKAVGLFAIKNPNLVTEPLFVSKSAR